MNTPLDLYKAFVAGLVSIRDGVLAKWTRDNKWPAVEKNHAITELLSSLSCEQREVIAGMLEHARDGGIHDTLVFLNDQTCLNELKLIQNGQELPVNPFDTTLYYDWTCRVHGDAWPDEE
jgi:hypothetical protein